MRFREPMGSHPHIACATAPPQPRAPDNELYDRGADLVEAAMAIRRVAGSPEASRAVPAVLGCIESALGELEAATTALEQAVAEVASTRPGWRGRRSDRVLERMHRGYTNLERRCPTRRGRGGGSTLTSRALGRTSRVHEARGDSGSHRRERARGDRGALVLQARRAMSKRRSSRRTRMSASADEQS